jgi:hypothetical protein
MNRIVILLLVCTAILSSCNPYKMQLVSLDCDKLKKDTTWFYKDSIVEIYYFCYTRDGKLTFTINNISDKPIFFDGKNSFILVGNNKYAYWQDVSVVKGTTSGVTTQGLSRYNHYSYGTINAVETKLEERMNLIPPKAGIIISKYFLHDKSLYNLAAYADQNDTVAVNWKTGSSKKTVIKKVNFEKANSPLNFRNFITLSRTEDFKTPLYYDFSFWATNIWEMDARQAIKSGSPEPYAEGAFSDGNFQNAQYHPYKKHWMFYLNNIYVNPNQ